MQTYLIPTNRFKDASTEELLGILGILILSLSAWKSPTGAYVGLTLILVASVALLNNPTYRLCWRNATLLIPLTLAGYILGWHFVLNQEQGISQNTQLLTKEWLLLLLPWCSYWFYRFPKLIPICLTLIMISLLIESLDKLEPYFHNLIVIWEDNLFIFHARGYGLYFSLVIIGLTIFLLRMWHTTKNSFLHWITRIIYLVCIAWFIQCLIASYARTAWGSLAVTLLLLVCIYLYYILSQRFTNRTKHLLGLLITVLTICSVFYINKDNISERLPGNGDIIAIQKIVTDGNDIPLTSASYRYFINIYGWEVWKSSPLVGLGPIHSKDHILQHENSKLHKLAHFHNTYLEIMIQLGIIGLFLCFLGIGLTFYRCIQSYKKGIMSGDYLLFLFLVLVAIAIYSLANYRLLNADWRFYWIILMAILQSQAINYQLQKKFGY